MLGEQEKVKIDYNYTLANPRFKAYQRYTYVGIY